MSDSGSAESSGGSGSGRKTCRKRARLPAMPEMHGPPVAHSSPPPRPASDCAALARVLERSASHVAALAALRGHVAFDKAVNMPQLRAIVRGERTFDAVRREFRLIRSNLIAHRAPVRLKPEDRPACSCAKPAAGAAGCTADCVNRLLQIECHPSNCPCEDRCSNQRLRTRAFAKYKILPAGEKGWGFFADQALRPGDLVIEYLGEVVDHAEALRRHHTYASLDHMYIMALRDGEYIDATMTAGMGRFINHSCEPNSASQMWTVDGEARVGIFAKRPIARGEEVSFDYKFERFGQAQLQRCFCGSAKCRGVIGTLREDNGTDRFFPSGKRRLRKGAPGKVQDPQTMAWVDAAPAARAHKELAHRITQLHLRQGGGLLDRDLQRATAAKLFLRRNAAQGLASYFAGHDSLLSAAEARLAAHGVAVRPAAGASPRRPRAARRRR